MQWSLTFAGKPSRIAFELSLGAGDLPATVRSACEVALNSVSPDRAVIFETSGFIDAASSDIRIEIKTCDSVV